MDVKISDNDFLKIAGRLKEVRKKLNLTLDHMAKATGSSKTGISEMERNIKNPESKYLIGLAKIFDVSVNWVLTGRGTMFFPEVELKLDFGKDNETIRELIYCLENIDEFRYRIMMEYIQFKRERKDAVNRALEKVKEE